MFKLLTIVFIILGILLFLRSLFGQKPQASTSKTKKANDRSKDTSKEKFFKEKEGRYIQYEEIEEN